MCPRPAGDWLSALLVADSAVEIYEAYGAEFVRGKAHWDNHWDNHWVLVWVNQVCVFWQREESLTGATCAGYNDGHRRARVDILHAGYLLGFLDLIVLDDTKSVHPEVRNGHFASNGDSVLDCLRQILDIDLCLELTDIVLTKRRVPLTALAV